MVEEKPKELIKEIGRDTKESKEYYGSKESRD
jgi:hypothetical protein